MRWMRQAVRALSAFAVLCAAGCLAYDHRWVQAQQQKQRARERLKPARLERQASGTPALRNAKVRAYVTRAYAAETLNWEARFEELLRDASGVLEPALGVRLENAGASLWQPTAREDQMGAVLNELTAQDSGEEVSWVVGFVKSTPELVFDHHSLGVGRVLSKYLVLRASNDPRELELLTHEYYGLGEAEVAKLHSERKRHRWVAVFLHEIGHTLGAQHRNERTTLMHPSYDPEQRAFDATTLGLLRIVAPANGSPSTDTYRAVLEYYRAHPDGWVGSEREEILLRLEPVARSEARASGARRDERHPPALVPPADPTSRAPHAETSLQPLTTLSEGDRRRYEGALEAEAKGDFEAAWKTLIPILETNARVLEVQDLRCRLARRQGLFWSVEEAHCEPAESLRAAQGR